MGISFFQPEQECIPRFTKGNIQMFLRTHFRMEGELTSLPSYYDQNFLLLSGSYKFVIKISNSSRDPRTIFFENRVLRCLECKSFITQRLVMRSNGDYSAFIADNYDEKYVLRVLHYIEGITLSELGLLSPLIIIDLGRTAAKLDNELVRISEEPPEVVSLWNLANARYTLTWLKYLPNEEYRNWVLQLLNSFDLCLLENMHHLQKSLIHGDFNLANLLVKDRNSTTIDGIIDFGELKSSFRIFELAIACMYVGLGKKDPLNEFVLVVIGYNSILPLTETEIQLLFPSICARICVSTIVSCRNSSLSPENKYVSAKCKPNLDLLSRVAKIDQDYAHQFFEMALV